MNLIKVVKASLVPSLALSGMATVLIAPYVVPSHEAMLLYIYPALTTVFGAAFVDVGRRADEGTAEAASLLGCLPVFAGVAAGAYGAYHYLRYGTWITYSLADIVGLFDIRPVAQRTDWIGFYRLANRIVELPLLISGPAYGIAFFALWLTGVTAVRQAVFGKSG